MIVKTTNEAEVSLDSVVDQANAAAEEICVVARSGRKAVVVAEEQWRAMQETLHLLSVPGLAESIREAAGEPLDEGVEWKKADWGDGASS